MIIHGEIVRLEPRYGFGFLRDDCLFDWFFIASGVRAGGLESLWVGEQVNFLQEATPSGPRAVDIHHESAD